MVRAFRQRRRFPALGQPGNSLVAFIADADEFEPHPPASLRDDDGARSDLQILSVPDARRQSSSTIYDETDARAQVPLRKPVIDGEMSPSSACASTRSCTTRRYTRASTGPRRSARRSSRPGNGVVIQADWTSGYGRRVEIQHANGYVTTYNHMSGFARGIVPGRARHAGPGPGLSRPVRPRDRPAPALRSHHQRQFRRPDGDQARAHARVRRPHARRLQARARPHRPVDGAGPERHRRRPASPQAGANAKVN